MYHIFPRGLGFSSLRLSSLRLIGLALVGLVPLTGTGAGAQEVLSQTLIYDTAEVRRLERAHTVQLTPSVVVLSPKSRTATFTLTNPTDRELTVKLSAQFYTIRVNPQGEFDTTADTLPDRNASSLTGWIKNLPEQITLAPRQSQPLVVALSLPLDKKGPEYWAQIVATSPAIQRNLQVVVKQLVSVPNGSATIVQQPALGDITLPMVSRSRLLYRSIPASAGTLRLGATPGTILKDGQVEICTEIVSLVRRTLQASVQLSVPLTSGGDTVMASYNIEIPGSIRPCFRALLPIEVTNQVPVTLRIEPNTTIPLEARTPFRDIRRTITLVPEPLPSSVSRDTIPAVPLIELQATRGALQAQLRREAAIAAREGKIPLVEVGAAWCGPCRAFLRSLTDSSMIEVLSQARVIRIDFDNWGQSFVNGPYQTPPALPLIFTIDANGLPAVPFDINRWQLLANQYGTLDARSIAPPLKEFLLELRKVDPSNPRTK